MSQPPLSLHHPYPSQPHARHQRWRLYAMLAGLIALGTAVSVMGRAWLGPAHAASQDNRVQVDYPRMTRSGAEQTLRITVRGEPGKAVKLMLAGPLLSQSRVEGIVPKPDASLRQGNALLLHLPAAASELRSVEVTLRSEVLGQLNGTLRAGPGSVVHLATYRYP